MAASGVASPLPWITKPLTSRQGLLHSGRSPLHRDGAGPTPGPALGLSALTREDLAEGTDQPLDVRAGVVPLDRHADVSLILPGHHRNLDLVLVVQAPFERRDVTRRERDRRHLGEPVRCVWGQWW